MNTSKRRQFRPLWSAITFAALATLAVGQSGVAETIKSITTADGGYLTLVSLDVDDNNDGIADRTLQETDLIRASIIDSPTDAPGEGIDFRGGVVDSSGQIVLPSGMAVPAMGQRAAMLDGDAYLSTGIVSLIQMELEFSQPVVNRPGADIFMFDTGGTDNITVTIGGQEVAYASNSANWTAGLKTGATFIVHYAETAEFSSLNDPGDADELTLERCTFSRTTTHNTSLNGLAINLDAFGVASGDSISRMIIESNGSVDPTYVGAVVPEPSSVVLLITAALGVLGMLRMRWNKRR